MAEPVKMVFDDGTELAARRCPHCNTPTLQDYRCAGCEAKGYREAAREVRAQMALLSAQLDRWSRDKRERLMNSQMKSPHSFREVGGAMHMLTATPVLRIKDGTLEQLFTIQIMGNGGPNGAEWQDWIPVPEINTK